MPHIRPGARRTRFVGLFNLRAPILMAPMQAPVQLARHRDSQWRGVSAAAAALVMQPGSNREMGGRRAGWHQWRLSAYCARDSRSAAQARLPRRRGSRGARFPCQLWTGRPPHDAGNVMPPDSQAQCGCTQPMREAAAKENDDRADASLGRAVGPIGEGRTRRRRRSTLVARHASLAELVVISSVGDASRGTGPKSCLRRRTEAALVCADVSLRRGFQMAARQRNQVVAPRSRAES